MLHCWPGHSCCKFFFFFFFFGGSKELVGGNSNIFGIFTPKIGEDEPILTFIFFKWVGSTTNQRMIGGMIDM